MKGRGEDWSALVSRKPVPEMVSDVKSAGFAGIYLDRFGYQDGGAAIDKQLVAATGSTPQKSPDQRLFFYRLR